MAKLTGYYKIVQPKSDVVTVTDNQAMGDPSVYGNFSHYHQLINGSGSRLVRYKEYDLMDHDVEVARALDIISEEITGNNPRSKEPILLEFDADDEQKVPNNIILTVQAALNTWNEIHEWDKRLFKLVRNTIKYGDCFFRKKNNVDKWTFLPAKTIVAGYARKDDKTKIDAWSVKTNFKETKSSFGVPVTGNNPNSESEAVPSKEIVRFTLNDDMSDMAPFGESVLRVVYKVYKQKELLEDAIIIYRIQRAPERRVFYVDVGKMPTQRIAKHLEQLKNEIKQKKIPTVNGGQNEIDTIYNPQSMSEDFFFAQRCIRLNTKIPLLDGREVTLQELITEYNDGKINFVYSVDRETGKLISGEVEWAGFTRKNAELIRVTLDNGEYLDCTPDHKIVLRDGSEVEAQFLKENDSIMPLVETNKRQVENAVSIEYLDFREDTGCLTIKDPGNNHNFAIASGIYIKNSDGKGSRVETLPGGEGLGELSDLEYFEDKLFRGLRVPTSYMKKGQESAIYNDGKVGIAYVEEQRFTSFVERLQTYIESVLDSEFKKYLRSRHVNIDTTLFSLRLPESANFSIYKQQELDAALLGNFGSLDGVEYIAKRFMLKRYLNLTDEEIALNEQMMKEEKGIDPDNRNLQAIYQGGEVEGVDDTGGGEFADTGDTGDTGELDDESTEEF